MRNLALAIACLACAGYGRRVRFASKPVKRSPPAVAQEPLKTVARGPELHSFAGPSQPMMQAGVEGTVSPWRVLAMLLLIVNTLAILRAYVKRARGSLSQVEKNSESADEPSKGAKMSEPFRTALSASPIIKMWKRIANTEADASTEDDEIKKEKLLSKMAEAQNILNEMARNLKRASPQDILALATKDDERKADSATDILALAMVTNHSAKDENGKLKDIAEKQGLGGDKQAQSSTSDEQKNKCAVVPVIVVGEVVAKPTRDRMVGLGKEILLRIVRLAAKSGRLVVLSPASEWLLEYYQAIGFESINSADRVGPMVYSKSLPELTDHEQKFKMVRLRLA